MCVNITVESGGHVESNQECAGSVCYRACVGQQKPSADGRHLVCAYTEKCKHFQQFVLASTGKVHTVTSWIESGDQPLSVQHSHGS